MVNIKRITIVLLSLFLAFSPIIENAQFSYATEEASWEDVVNHSQVCAALKAYAMAEYKLSHTFSFGSADPITSAIVNFSYNQWYNIAKENGIDLTALQNSLKYRVANNGALQFFYSGSFIQDYNTLIQKYLEKQGLTGNNYPLDKLVYSGEIFTDLSGYVCYVYIQNNYNSQLTGAGSQQGQNADITNILSFKGTTYKYTDDDLKVLIQENGSNVGSYKQYSIPLNVSSNLTNVSFKYRSVTNNNVLTEWVRFDDQWTNNLGNIYKTDSEGYYTSDLAIIKYTNSNNYSSYWLGNVGAYYVNGLPPQLSYYYYNRQSQINYPNTNEAIVNASKYGANAARTAVGKNAAISVGVQGGENAQDAIENYLKDNEPEEPTIDPDVPADGEPDLDNPDDPENPNVNIGFPIGGIFANGQFSFQMPDLSNLPNNAQGLPSNFSLSALKTKFPFCLVYDIPAILSLLEDTPQAPRIQGQIDLGVFNYNIDINLNYFDNVMAMVRNIIFLLYCFALIFITKELLF